MKRGFTLVEMLTIIAIIGVLVGAAWPLIYPAQQRAQTKLAAQQIADQLRLAQEQTLSEQDVYGVQFDVAGNIVTVVTYGESYDGTNDPAIVVETKALESNTKINSTTLIDPQTGAAEVRFAKTGVPTITGTVTVTNASGASQSGWQVEVAPSGLIKVYQ